MEQLISSRMQQKREPLNKLENLSPQKFGRAAYADLSFTPSKLADNVIFREVSTMKKYEEGTNKLREFEALNSFFKDRIKQIQTQRDGIQQSLLQQITMYKKMLNEVEVKNQSRIKEIQKSFSLELHKIIEEKEQQAKFAQSQKEILQARIAQLLQQINKLRSDMGNAQGQLDDLNQQKEKLQIRFQNLNEKLQQTEKTLQQQRQQSKKNLEMMRNKALENEKDYESKMKNYISEKQKQFDNLQKLHKTELEKLQNKRANDELKKNQQLQDVRQTFENETKRLNEIISMKDRMIESLTEDNNKEKALVVDLTKTYEAQINNLFHQKGRLLEQIQALNDENGKLTFSLKDIQNQYFRQKSKLQSLICKLKQQLELIDLNFARVKEQNQCLRKLADENQMLYRQVKNLRDLLFESSMEMEKCKEQFLKLGCEKDQLLLKLREMGFQRESLLRMKHEKQEQAKNWKDSYYMGRIRK